MSIMIAQIGDIHIYTEKDHILQKADQIAAAISSDSDLELELVVLLITGDVTQSGSKHEFAQAADFFTRLKEIIVKRTKCEFEIVSIPGNHDVDLSGEQALRNSLVEAISMPEAPQPSILEVISQGLTNYYDFSSKISTSKEALDRDHPFFRTRRLKLKSGMIDLHLFNTAWMCIKGQSPGSLFFPLESISIGYSDSPIYSISVLHHPFNWFRQPSTMRPLKDKIEHSSDMIISGHEHGNDAFGKTPLGNIGVLQYLEGGVLQERGDNFQSSFTVMVFDFESQTQRIVRYNLNRDGIYERQPGSEAKPIRVNVSRKDRRFEISTEFNQFLNDPDLPLSDAKQRTIQLSDIFTYPDLREPSNTSGQNWRRIRGEKVLEELLGRTRSVIAAGPKAGKTSLAKSLFTDFLGSGRLPVYMDGSSLMGLLTDEVIRKAISKSIRSQYAKATVEEYEQTGGEKTTLIIDNLHLIDDSRNGREQFLQYVENRFNSIVAFADTEFILEHLHAPQGSSRKIVKYNCLYICEFGYISIESLAKRWVSSGRDDRSKPIESEVKQVCKTVRRVLKINAIPHHPWVLIVLLQEATSGQEIAAKNGSYGHLFQAIVTSALYRSRHPDIDIQTKYSYLAGLANHMYESGLAVLDDQECRLFHESHCNKYDLDLNYKDMIDDMGFVNILRSDGNRISFRTKYCYWFFVAWYISRQIYTDVVRDRVSHLCKCLHHEDTANIFIFLAHLSTEPIILHSILEASKTLFAESPMATLDDDIEAINLLQPSEIQFRLPSTDPDENQRLLLEKDDEAITRRDHSATDGREVSPTASLTNDESADDFTRFIRTLQASMKTIDILGQVLRNGAGSIDADEKQDIVNEIYRLSRRVNGNILQDLRGQLPGWCAALDVYFDERYPNDSKDERVNRVLNRIMNTLWIITYALTRRVSHSLAHELLKRTFEKVVAADNSIPNRLFDLSIKLDIANGIPSNEAESFYKQMKGNVLVRTVIRALVINHLCLYKIPHSERQSICKKLEIDLDSQMLQPGQKKSKEVIRGAKGVAGDDRGKRRKEKKNERQRRGK